MRSSLKRHKEIISNNPASAGLEVAKGTRLKAQGKDQHSLYR
jgi:hypothetical protein